jgi:carbohydrate-selective porin OprB
MIYWFGLFATIILFPAIAEAQVQTDTTLPPLLIPLEPLETFPPSSTQGGYLFNLRPIGADFGQTLADHGIYIIARNLSEEIAVVSGGLKRGASYEGYTTLGFDLDIERIAGITGGAIHFLLDDLQGQPFYAYSAAAYLNNRIFAGDGPALRVNEFSYEQNLFNQQVNLRLGRLPAYTQFDGSELYCTFITSLCRTPAAYTFNRGYPPYLASSWAAVAQIRIAGAFYTNIGVFENEPVAATTSHGGFPGPDWGLNYANGATFPVQFGYRTTLQNDPYPRAFSVGGFYVTGTYADPLLNTDGQNRILAGGTAKMDYGSSQIYVQAQQMVYRPDASDRGLTLFGGANWATSGEPDVERMVFAGAYYKGPFAQRPNDSLGFAVSLVDVNPRLTERINSVLSKTTGGQASASEIDYEVYYGIAVAPGMTLKPFFGFMSHPDQVNNPAPSGNITHAAYLGVLFEVDMAHLFGLPTLSR